MPEKNVELEQGGAGREEREKTKTVVKRAPKPKTARGKTGIKPKRKRPENEGAFDADSKMEKRPLQRQRDEVPQLGGTRETTH